MEKCFVCEKEFQTGALEEVKCEDQKVLVCSDCVDEFKDQLEQDRLTQTCRVCGLKTATRRRNMEEVKQEIAGICYPCWKKGLDRDNE